jgi:hypothetical protein
MCCVCQNQALNLAAKQAVNLNECLDSNNGATDAAGDSCAWYAANPGYCGVFDDYNFNAGSMCCSCGGGSKAVSDEFLQNFVGTWWDKKWGNKWIINEDLKIEQVTANWREQGWTDGEVIKFSRNNW